MAERKVVDWERVEAEYRAGVVSLAELASMYGISKGRICQVAKAQGWVRDLQAKILAKAEDKLNRLGLSDDLNTKQRSSERVVVEARANDVATVRLSHRTDIQRSKRIANRLLEHLESLPVPPAPTPDKALSDQMAQNTLCLGILKDQSAILDKLVGTQKTLVAMEREAFGIAQMVESPEAPATANPMDVARRIAFGLARAGSQLTQQ